MASSPAGSAPFGETIRYGGCDCCSGTPPCPCCLDSIPDCVVTITDSPCADLIGAEADMTRFGSAAGFSCEQRRGTETETYLASNFQGYWDDPYFFGVDITASIGQATLDTLMAPFYANVAVPAGGVNKAFLSLAIDCVWGNYSVYNFHLFLVNWAPTRPVTGNRILAAIELNSTVTPTIDVNCCPFALTVTDVAARAMPSGFCPTTGILPCLGNPGLWSFALTGTRTGCTGEGGGD